MINQVETSKTNKPKFDKKLDQILAVSARVFARDGYEKASIRRIASELEMSIAGLYHYVTSKKELLFLIQYRTFSSLKENLETKAAAQDSPREKLRTIIENHLEHFLSRMDQLVVCTHEMTTLEGDYYEEVLKKRHGYFLATQNILKEIEASAPGAGIDPNLATLFLFGMLNWIYKWYDPSRNTSLQVLIDQMEQLFLNGYLPRDKDQVKQLDQASNIPQ